MITCRPPKSTFDPASVPLRATPTQPITVPKNGKQHAGAREGHAERGIHAAVTRRISDAEHGEWRRGSTAGSTGCADKRRRRAATHAGKRGREESGEQHACTGRGEPAEIENGRLGKRLAPRSAAAMERADVRRGFRARDSPPARPRAPGLRPAAGTAAIRERSAQS